MRRNLDYDFMAYFVIVVIRDNAIVAIRDNSVEK